MPTIAATGFEAFIIILASQVTVLFPFKELQNRFSKSALIHNYDKTPPHLSIVYALRVRNLLLALLSFTVLGANVLAVALGGLFYKGVKEFKSSTSLELKGTMEALAALNSTSMIAGQNDVDYRSFYIMAGLGLGFEENRPWTMDGLFFIPLSSPSLENGTYNPNSDYTVEGWGIGVKANCKDLAPHTRVFRVVLARLQAPRRQVAQP